jgi:PTH1 family peptidyl-tRNA hydrolase
MPYLIVGLGNPGKEYEQTRHNLGFMILGALVEKTSATPLKTKYLARLWNARVGKAPVILMEPQTFMNLSGQVVAPFMKTKGLGAEDLIVVHDDLDLPYGMLRISENSSAAGHNGVQSIIDHLGTQNFFRVRIGIGRPADPVAIEDYVLARFSAAEKKTLPELLERSILEIEKIFQTSSK